jgi:hypothetical protein
MALFNVVETCDCTATSPKRFGRYLRARASDMAGTGIYVPRRSGTKAVSIQREAAARRDGEKAQRGDGAR